MKSIIPVHGGNNGGPRPTVDLSTNANSLGPCRQLLESVRAADYSRYPDPAYQSVRFALGAAHGVSAERIVVGPGASELILRLIRRHHGAVRVLGPTFSEYHRCARLEGRPYGELNSSAAFAAAQRPDEGLGFACWPNNPTGEAWSLTDLAEAARRGRVVVDMAYVPLCGAELATKAKRALSHAIQLYSPNKAFGLTGVRAAYLVLPEPDERLQWLGASWSLDAGGEAFLMSVHGEAASDWLARTVPVLQANRARLATTLQGLGIEVMASPANFLMARLGNPVEVNCALATRGFRLRDAASFGLPGWFRIGVPGNAEVLDTLIETIRRELCSDSVLDGRGAADAVA